MSQKNTALPFDRVLIAINISTKGGEVLLRAMNGWETEVHHLHLTFAPEDLCTEAFTPRTSDEAKMVALIIAMKRLVEKLPSKRKASYALIITQSSRNVDGWICGSYQRKAANTQLLAGYIDRLMQYFPSVSTYIRKRNVIESLISDVITQPETSEVVT